MKVGRGLAPAGKCGLSLMKRLEQAPALPEKQFSGAFVIIAEQLQIFLFFICLVSH